MEIENKNHDTMMLALGEMKGSLQRSIEGTNSRLDTLNSSVSKHEARHNQQDVLNAQITLTQGQIVKDQSKLQEDFTENNKYVLRTQGSINTFKWLVGFVGLSTLITLLKVLGFIGWTH